MSASLRTGYVGRIRFILRSRRRTGATNPRRVTLTIRTRLSEPKPSCPLAPNKTERSTRCRCNIYRKNLGKHKVEERSDENPPSRGQWWVFVAALLNPPYEIPSKLRPYPTEP